MSARVPALLGLALAACSPSIDGAPLFGEPRPLYDLARAAPAWCVPGENCTALNVDCVEPVPDGEGGAFCRAPDPANADVMQLVHVGGDGAEVSRHRLGNRVYPRLALSPSKHLAGTGSGLVESFAGVPAGALTEAQRGGGWVGVRRPDGTGWHLYFGTGVQFEDVAWLADGRVVVLGNCTGQHTVPLALDCSTSPGSSLFVFAADGSGVQREHLPDVLTPRKVAVGPGGALYVLEGTSVGAVGLHRVDDGHRWSQRFDRGYVPHVPTPLVVAADGRPWLTVGALVIVSPDGVVDSAQPSSSDGAWGNEINGFAPLANGEVLAWWVGQGFGGRVGVHDLSGPRLVQHLPDGAWRGFRSLAPKQNGGTVEVFSDAEGRVYLNGFGFGEVPGVHFVRLDPVTPP